MQGRSNLLFLVVGKKYVTKSIIEGNMCDNGVNNTIATSVAIATFDNETNILKNTMSNTQKCHTTHQNKLCIIMVFFLKKQGKACCHGNHFPQNIKTQNS